MASSSKRAAAPATADDLARNRKMLRGLIQQTESNHEELTAVDSSGLAQVQGQANEAFELSRQEARAAALDATLLHNVSRLGAEQAGKLDKQSPEEFVKRLLAKYGMGGGEGRQQARAVLAASHRPPRLTRASPPLAASQKLNFPILANDIEQEGIFQRVPAITFLLDANWAPAPPKEKKQREKKQRTTDEELQAPAAAPCSSPSPCFCRVTEADSPLPHPTPRAADGEDGGHRRAAGERRVQGAGGAHGGHVQGKQHGQQHPRAPPATACCRCAAPLPSRHPPLPSPRPLRRDRAPSATTTCTCTVAPTV